MTSLSFSPPQGISTPDLMKEGHGLSSHCNNLAKKDLKKYLPS